MRLTSRLSVLLCLSAMPVLAQSTSTGFSYPTPTATPSIFSAAFFGATPADGYFANRWHCAADIRADVGTSVRAIADGDVDVVSTGGWGTGNVGLIVKHRASNGRYFLAVYGHVRNYATGHVNRGDQIGTVGPWTNGNHLHFGVYEAEDGNGGRPYINTSEGYGWGMRAMPRPAGATIDGVQSYDRWLDPIEYIRKRTPWGGPSDDPNAPTDLYPSGWNNYSTVGPLTFQWHDNGLRNGQPCHHLEIVVQRWVNGQAGDVVLHVPSATNPYSWTGYGVGQYVWHVTAYNAANEWARSEDAYFRTYDDTPKPATDLYPSGWNSYSTAGPLNFQWHDNRLKNGEPTDHFEIVVRKWENGQAGAQVLHVPSTTSPYSWTGYAVGDYVWHVTAYNGANLEARSDDAYFRVFAPPPTVTARSPTGINFSAEFPTITATFSTAMTKTAAQGALSISPAKPGANAHGWPGSYSWVGNQMKYKLSTSLAPNTTYTVKITKAAKSAVGLGMAADKTWTFTTNNLPAVTSHSPTGTADPLSPAGRVITIGFNQAMNKASAQGALWVYKTGSSPSLPAGTFPAWVGNTMSYRLASKLAPLTSYTVKLSTGARSLAGVKRALVFTWAFTTDGASTSPSTVSVASAPTASGAQITVNLSATANVTVSVRNLAGREIALLTPGALAAGMHSLLWNGKSKSGTRVPAGRYLLQVNANSADGTSARAMTSLPLR